MLLVCRYFFAISGLWWFHCVFVVVLCMQYGWVMDQNVKKYKFYCLDGQHYTYSKLVLTHTTEQGGCGMLKRCFLYPQGSKAWGGGGEQVLL